MDPDKCFDEILTCLASREYDRALEFAENLQGWLAKGGFLPGGGKLEQAAITRFIDWVLDDLPH